MTVDVALLRELGLTPAMLGDPPAFVYARNALHHLPDFWKAIAFVRTHDLLAAGGTLVLRDIVYSYARYACVKR